MADTKISNLPAVVTPVGTDEIPVNQGGTTKKLTITQATAVHEAASDPHPGYLTQSEADALYDATGAAAARAPADATYLTTTAQAGLSAEVVVGATPGGELGNTWASPTVDASHSGSTHAATQAAAESTAAGALTTHEAAADPHAGYLKESVVSGFATPGLTLGTANAAGAATTGVRTDATILAFDATGPAAVGTQAVGAATVAARRDHVHATGAGTPSTQAIGDSAATGSGPAAAMTDHKHAMPAFGTGPAAVGTQANGSSANIARIDHVHATGAGTPSTQAFGDAAATGTGPAAAMTDHKHAMMADPVTAHAAAADPHTGYVLESLLDAKGDLITASADNTPAKLTVGSDDTILMADASAGGGLKWVASQTPSTQASADAAAQGTADTYARGDHKHGMPTLATVLAAPTFVAVGTSATGTGDITPALPTGHTTNDILLLFVQSSNQTVVAPATYTQLGPQVGIGAATVALSTRLSIFWKRDGGAESNPTVTDAGDHTLAQIMAIRGCVTTGDPFVSVGQTRKTTASTTGTAMAGSTDVDQCLVVNAFAHGIDSASAVFSSWTNASLASVTEQIDVATTDGTGGGIGVSTGVLAVAGPFVATTVTETSTADVSSTFTMLPAGCTRDGTDIQVFLTPGFADTWTKPTSAKAVSITAIGGGASGSAGRNAATAAGGGGGGGGAWGRFEAVAASLAATCTVTAGAGGAATANTDGTASNVGSASTMTSGGSNVASSSGGAAAGVSATGSGGLGGNGGGAGSATSAGVVSYGIQPTGGGTGGTTGSAGGSGADFAGGAGGGGGTTQAGASGGNAWRGGAGGGGGRSNTNVSIGGASLPATAFLGGATAGANGVDSPFLGFGGSGAAGGGSAAGPGGQGGWPGGGGGGGGSQSGAQRGGAGGDGVVVIVTVL